MNEFGLKVSAGFANSDRFLAAGAVWRNSFLLLHIRYPRGAQTGKRVLLRYTCGEATQGMMGKQYFNRGLSAGLSSQRRARQV
jgi:hypothetical protein